MLDYISKKSKFIFAILYTLYAVVAPAGVISVKAAEAPHKGDIYDAATNTYGDSTSVKVSTGSLEEEGNIEITKTISKTDTLGKYKVSFDIKSKKVTEHTTVPIYTIFVVDASSSMDSNSAWTNAKNAAIEASKTLIDSDENAKVALVTFNSDAHILKNFQHAYLTDSDFGSTASNTNYDAGLMRALELLNNTTFEENAIKNVIFLSDGSPNVGLARLEGVSDENTYTSGHGHNTHTTTTYSASSISGYFFVPDDYTYLTGAANHSNRFIGFTKDSNGNFEYPGHEYDYDGTYTRNGTLASIKAKLTGEHEHVYSIAYNIDSETSTTSQNLAAIASGPDYYKFTDSSGIGEILAAMAHQISESAAGTNATLVDNLGSAFTVTGSDGTSYTQTIGEIGETNSPIEFMIEIDPNSPTGMYDTNAGFTLTYTDPEGASQTLNCDTNPQVYWEGPEYTINYFIEGESSPFNSETVTSNVRLNDVINEDKLIDKIATNTPTGYGYKNLDPESITVGEDKTQNVINVYYAKIPVNIVSNTIAKTGTDKITHTDDELTYVVTYNATIDDFAGSAYITIVDKLPYPINPVQTNITDLDGGVYNSTDNTITWNITIDDIDTFTSKQAKEIAITKTYKVVYTGIDAAISSSTNNTFENKAEATLTVDGSDYLTEEAKQVTLVAVEGKVISNYYLDGTEETLAESEENTGLVGSNYTTSEKDIYGYTLKETPSNATGPFAVDDTVVNYYYTKNPGEIDEDVDKEADETLANINEAVNYTINYSATIDDYVGEATVTITDNLPYAIDEEKSELDGGSYSADDKTITWTESFNIDENNKDIDITKNIKLYYNGINSDTITNNVDTETTFGQTTSTDEDDAETKVAQGKVTATYTDEAGETLAPSEVQTGRIGDSYTTEEKTIYGYTLRETPSNASDVYTEDDITVEYVYIKNIGELVTSNLEKEGTDLENINESVSYTISYNAELNDFVGNVKTLIVDTPEFTVDSERSDFDGGTYDPETNTITWEITTAIDEENRTITFNKTLNIYYIDIDKDTIQNDVNSTLTYDESTDSQEASVVTNVAKGKVTATYTAEDGTTLADPEEQEGFVGADYTTEEKEFYGYTLKETPSNANDVFTAEDITVEYIYTKDEGTIDENATKEADETLANINDGVNYTIGYTATIDDYVGEATVTITDNLPYAIDEEKSELDGGTYNADDKTITWTENFNIDEENKDIDITKNIKLYYIGIDADTITNTIDTETTFGENTSTDEDEAVTEVEKGKVTATYTAEDGTVLADPVEQTGRVGDSYTTEEKEFYGYTLKETPSNANDVFTAEDITVEYIYTKDEGTIDEEATKEADDVLANINEGVNYTISYTATIDDYVGEATVTITDNLPYAIDEEKSELDGGTYDSESKTITWEETFIIDEDNKDISITKNIKLYYNDIDADTITNTIDTETTFGQTTSTDDDDAETKVEKGKVTATYTAEDGTTLADPVEQTGRVGEEYTTEAKEFYGYTLKEIPSNASDVYTKEDITVEYIYTKNEGTIDEDVTKEADATLANINEGVNYTITYNATIDDYVGDATVTITDNLPYEIDEEKSELDGGTYNSDSKTITWEETFTIDEDNKDIDITKNLTLYYIGIDSDTITNTIDTETTFGQNTSTDDDDSSTDVEKGKVIATYTSEDGTVLADPVEQTGRVGEEYTTEAKEFYGYTLKETPENANDVYTKEDITVEYIYTKDEGTIDEEATKTADETLASINDGVNYTIGYTATIDDYVGDATVTITDNLPYEIDEEKSELDGGTYDSESKTITWTENYTIDENNKDIDITKNIKLYYIGIDSDTITNTINTETTFGETTSTDDDDAETKIEKGKVTATYTAEDGTVLADPVEQTGRVGEEYTTEAKEFYGYTLKEIPSNASDVYTKEDITVEYIYTKNEGTIDEDATKEADEILENINNGVNYTITYTATIDDYVGDASVTITDNLPYEIDEEKSELDGGTYSADDKTITWTENYTIDENNKDIDITKNITLYYKNIDSETITNTIDTETTFGETTSTDDDNAETKVEKGKVTATYTAEDGTVLANPEEQEGLVGDSYTTEEKEFYGYTLKETPSNANDVFTKEDITVEYVYTKNKGEIDEDATKEADATLANINEGVNYTIGYTATIDDYIGEATVTITDNLPYAIDEEKSELDGGTYNADDKTITWSENFNIDENNKDIDITKNIKLYYIGIDADTITNTMDTETTFGETTSTDDDDAETKVEKGKVIATYTAEDGTVLADPVEQTGRVGDSYTTEAKEFYGYTLKETPSNASDIFTKEDIIVEYVYVKSDGTIEEEVGKTSDETLANINEGVNYTITYNATIDDFIGEATTTLVDNLPYEIDTDKSELDGGFYNMNDKTITWTDVKDIDENNREISITKNIKLYYKNIDSDSITNNLDTETTFGKTTKTNDDDAVTKVKKGKVVVRYVDVDGKEIAPSITLTGLVGQTYQTSEQKIGKYFLSKVIGDREGYFTGEDIEVTYVYDIENTPAFIIPPQTGVTNSLTGIIAAKLMMLVLILFAFKKSKEA